MPTQPTEPRIALHHGRECWYTQWYSDDGRHRRRWLGDAAEVSRRQARLRYESWLLHEYRSKEHVRNPQHPSGEFTCSRLAGRYLRYAFKVYRKRGKPTAQALRARYGMRALRDAYGKRLADEIQSPDLARLRDSMVEGEDGPRALATVNGYLAAVKAGFAWARERGEVSRATLLDLQSVRPLQRGRSDAVDPVPVRALAYATIQATLEHATPTVRALAEFVYLTGCRPGEACLVRACDLDTSGKVWVYTPSEFKMEHREGVAPRQIAVGPRAQEVLKPYLTTDTQAYIFSPQTSVREWLEARAAASEHPSRAGVNRVAQPQRRPGVRYTVGAFRKALHSAARMAGIEPWNPNQLRHSRATEVRREFGLLGSADTLGHANVSTTQIYAEMSLERAKEIALKVG